MKKLKDILYKVPLVEVYGFLNTKISGIAFDSRAVKKNFLFVAIKGLNADGHKFIGSVVKKGASVIVCEKIPKDRNRKLTYIAVKNSAEALGILASNFYNNPSEKLKIVGVTGTNGKTTIATLLYQLYSSLGYKCGLISTVNIRIDKKEFPARFTTPDSITLNELFAKTLKEECTHCFMEVSSHSVAQGRISGIQFTGAIFTNLTHDHLDYHKTFRNYRDTKKILFDTLHSSAFALVNADDANGMFMVQNTKAKIFTYALKKDADFKSKVLENSFLGLCVKMDGEEVWFKFPGTFNAYNVTAVYGASKILDEDKKETLTHLSNLSGAKGRFEIVRAKNKTGIVDYAHTPDALKNILQTIAEIKNGTQHTVTVVGCGGNRDRAKRPLMAKIACELSGRVVLTSDNPRNENPNDILAEMQKGISVSKRKNVLTITDRREAIRTAVRLAKNTDVILIAGKGHENYQEIKGKRFPFDDKKILTEAFRE